MADKPVIEHWYQKQLGPLPMWQWLLGAKLALIVGVIGQAAWKDWKSRKDWY